ncbi:MAG: type VI secretion system contractile sheath large subunit [Planctomycetaceae bacterium]
MTSLKPEQQSATWTDTAAPLEDAPGLLDQLVATGIAAEAETGRAAPPRLQRFLDEADTADAIALWIGDRVYASRRELVERLGRDVAEIDELLSEQVDAILHDPRFQKLEASWRGLSYLVEQAGEAANVKVRVLNATRKELARDLERAIEFDQSTLFRKVYSEEFGTPGGQPFGLLVGDYEVYHHPEHVEFLKNISKAAAAAFAPFITGVGPAMFGLDDFGGLELPLDLPRTFQQTEYVKWKSLRETEDGRFIGLALPRVLMRPPYEDNGLRNDGFRFVENVAGPNRSRYLWGNAAYALAAVAVRAFAESGWLANIRGVQPGVEGGGLVTGLPSHSFGTDKRGLVPKCSTDVIITDAIEQHLGELGFIPLCDCKDTEYSAFYGNQSIQKPKVYDRLPATINARLSAMLQYMLCVSRFAHYLKIIGRDKVGSFLEARECQSFLQDWLRQYVTAGDDLTDEVKARYPLREGRVEVGELPGKPGSYRSVFHLRPHYQLDELVASIRLVTELAPAGKREG